MTRKQRQKDAAKERMRLKRAKDAQAAARARRIREDEEGRANLRRLMEGTSWGDPKLPKSDVERQRKRRAQFYDIGTIPAPADPVRRESCRFDLPRFLITYCGDILDHDPSPELVVGMVRPLESAILYGGMELLLSARGTGKTTIIKGATRWALAYGHKRFVVTIAATRDLAVEGIFDETVNALGGDGCPAFAEDFPGLTIPISRLGGNKKASRTQTSHGRPTGMHFKATRVTLPSVVDGDGNFIEPSHGAVFVACSMGGAIKGLVNKKERPDLFLIDDPQTEGVAKSHVQTVEAEKFIVGSVLGLAGHLQEPTAVMAITPIRVGDLACRFMDRREHGEWHMVRLPYVTGWTDRHDSLFVGYKAAYDEDVSIGDGERKLSLRFYMEHRREFEDLKLVDRKNYTDREVDAVHHLLNLRIRLKGEFAAECLLDVHSESAGDVLEPEDVERAVTSYPRFALPSGTYECVAFCDVNVSEGAGLRFGVCAFGPNRVASFTHTGRYPEPGKRLYPAGADPETKEKAIIDGIIAVVRHLMCQPYYVYDTGESVRLRAIMFDGGFEQATVDKALKWIGGNINMGGTHLYWSRGFGWSQYKSDIPGVQVVKDHMHSAVSRSKDGSRIFRFIAIHADYWKEVAQKAYRIRYPLRGSLSIHGDMSATDRATWAEETCNEQLVRTYRDERRMCKAWEWNVVRPGHSHSFDIAYNCLALGHWEGLYTALAPIGAPRPAEEPAASAPETAEPVHPPAVHYVPVAAKVPRHAHAAKSIFKKCRRSGGGGRVP